MYLKVSKIILLMSRNVTLKVPTNIHEIVQIAEGVKLKTRFLNSLNLTLCSWK